MFMLMVMFVLKSETVFLKTILEGALFMPQPIA